MALGASVKLAQIFSRADIFPWTCRLPKFLKYSIALECSSLQMPKGEGKTKEGKGIRFLTILEVGRLTVRKWGAPTMPACFLR